MGTVWCFLFDYHGRHFYYIWKSEGMGEDKSVLKSLFSESISDDELTFELPLISFVQLFHF